MMSGYLSHFLGYVFQIFKKENYRKKNSSATGNIARKCNSVMGDRELKRETEKVTIGSESSKCSLKRVNSCPQISEEYTVHTKDGPRCRTCSDKLTNLDSIQETALSETNKESKQNKSKEMLTTDTCNSLDFVEPLKTINNSTLRRFRSLDLQSFDDDDFLQNVKNQSRNIYLSNMGAGDGKYAESKKIENSKLNRNQKFGNQSELVSTRVERICQKDFVSESPVNNDFFRKELETPGGKLSNSKTLQESCCFDVPAEMQREMKKDFGEQKFQLGAREESFTEDQYLEHLTLYKEAKLELPQQGFFDDIEESEVYATPLQDRRLSCRSKIPVHQRVRRLSEGGKFTNCSQSGWRRSSRSNLCLKSLTQRGRARRCHTTRHSTSRVTTAYRHQLNSRLDRMFREFSKNIYRGNIMDHSSHSRWMKLAGIVEEQDASSFKSYAKSKVVLTLSEYKEALLKMCEDHHLDYWDVLKQMTDVRSGGKTISYCEKDDDSIENADEE